MMVENVLTKIIIAIYRFRYLMYETERYYRLDESHGDMLGNYRRYRYFGISKL